MQVPGCLVDLLALGEHLVVEHVGVAALLAEIVGEGVAGPHLLSRGSSSSRDCATTERGIDLRSASAASASLPP